MCVSCRVKKPKIELKRFSYISGVVQIDETKTMQTRGQYVCSDSCLDKFKQKKTKSSKRKGSS